jgi:hypothetical protein
MKKVIILAVVITLTVQSHAQETVSATAQEEYTYCQIVGTRQLMTNKVTIEIDFGQASTWFKNTRILRDENGKPITFNSMIDAMNYLGRDGWEFVQAFALTHGNTNVYHFLLKKNIQLLSEEERQAFFSNYRVTK